MNFKKENLASLQKGGGIFLLSGIPMTEFASIKITQKMGLQLKSWCLWYKTHTAWWLLDRSAMEPYFYNVWKLFLCFVYLCVQLWQSFVSLSASQWNTLSSFQSPVDHWICLWISTDIIDNSKCGLRRIGRKQILFF